MNKTEELKNKIFIEGVFLQLNSYHNGKSSFSILEENFYDLFVEYEGVLEESIDDFFSDICEKMDYTSLNKLLEEDKKYGWITDVEFKKWLGEKLKKATNK